MQARAQGKSEEAEAGGALAALQSSAESGDALFHVKDNNSWESRGVERGVSKETTASRDQGQRGLTFNPTAGDGSSPMGVWADKIVGSRS